MEWKYLPSSENQRYGRVVDADDDLGVCDLGYGTDDDKNGRLIAAAPKLLAVVERMMKEYEDGVSIGLIEDAQAALSQAKGGA